MNAKALLGVTKLFSVHYFFFQYGCEAARYLKIHLIELGKDNGDSPTFSLSALCLQRPLMLPSKFFADDSLLLISAYAILNTILLSLDHYG